MSAPLSILLFVIGVVIIIEATEKFIEGLLRLASLLRLSTFALAVVFSGFEPENLVAGIAAALRQLPGVAMGTVIGSAIFMITVALGLAAIFVPLHVNLPKRYLVVMLASPIPLFFTMWDQMIDRWEGLILVILFGPVIWYMLRASGEEAVYLSQKGLEDVITKHKGRRRYTLLVLITGSLVAITIGAELMARGAKGIVSGFGISDTAFGMVFVAAAISFEEIVREIVPAYKGHPEISIGNILGTILFFVLFNIGIIAMIAPLRVEPSTIRFHWPSMMITLVLTSVFLLRKHIGRIEGIILLMCYLVYVMLNLKFQI